MFGVGEHGGGGGGGRGEMATGTVTKVNDWKVEVEARRRSEGANRAEQREGASERRS